MTTELSAARASPAWLPTFIAARTAHPGTAISRKSLTSSSGSFLNPWVHSPSIGAVGAMRAVVRLLRRIAVRVTERRFSMQPMLMPS